MDEQVIVSRGKGGFTQKVDVYDLAVGDIIHLDAGSKVPADSVLIEGTDVLCNEDKFTCKKIFIL